MELFTDNESDIFYNKTVLNLTSLKIQNVNSSQGSIHWKTTYRYSLLERKGRRLKQLEITIRLNLYFVTRL